MASDNTDTTSNELPRDRLATHAVVNYLLAGYQGKFAYCNILSQLSHPLFNAEILNDCKYVLDRAAFWLEDLWKDNLLFHANWTKAETFEAQNALELLDRLKLDLIELIKEIIRILSLPQIPDKYNDIALLAASFGRFAYGREHYIRGFMNFAQKFELTDDQKRYAAMLPASEDDINLVHTILGVMRDKSAATKKDFVSALGERVIPLVSLFRTHLHDINQLVSTYRGGFSFERGDFTAPEAFSWIRLGFAPIPAGYWRANGFSPDDAAAWVEAQISSPGVAVLWKSAGFNATNSSSWAQRNIPPVVARAWLNAGFSAEETKNYLEKGITDPKTIKRGEG